MFLLKIVLDSQRAIENAVRLLDALQRVKAKTNQPQTIEDLGQEFGLYHMVMV